VEIYPPFAGRNPKTMINSKKPDLSKAAVAAIRTAVSIFARQNRMTEDMAKKVFDLFYPAMSADGTIGEDEQTKTIEQFTARAGKGDPPPWRRYLTFRLCVRSAGN
jgi:hypothetical protein